MSKKIKVVSIRLWETIRKNKLVILGVLIGAWATISSTGIKLLIVLIFFLLAVFAAY